MDFFYGSRLVKLEEKQQAFIASPGKALLDLVYLEPEGDTPNYLAELRLNKLERLEWQLLERHARQIKRPKLLRAITAIQALAREEGEFEALL